MLQVVLRRNKSAESIGTRQPLLHQSYENCPLVKLNNLDFLVPRLKTYFHLDLQAFIEEKETLTLFNKIFLNA